MLLRGVGVNLSVLPTVAPSVESSDGPTIDKTETIQLNKHRGLKTANYTDFCGKVA